MIRTTVNDDSLKNFLAVSAGLHLLAFLSFYIGLPVFFPPFTPPHPPVPFEIVEIADITNTRVKEPEQQQPTPPPPPPPQPKAEPTPPPQPPQPKPPEPVPDAESLKPMKKPLVKQEEPKPQNQEAFSKLLKNLEIDKKPPAPKTPDIQEKTTPKSTSAETTPANSQAALSDRLTISQEDALRRQISQCWNMPIGARDAQTLVVEVVIDVNPDRTVQNIEVVDKMRMATDSFFRAAAESAVRALNNPKCSPLELPPDQYEQWKVIHFTFDPRDML